MVDLCSLCGMKGSFIPHKEHKSTTGMYEGFLLVSEDKAQSSQGMKGSWSRNLILIPAYIPVVDLCTLCGMKGPAPVPD